MKNLTVIIVIILFSVWISPVLSFDFNGDGKDDVTICRSSSGLWAVRGVTRVYFGDVGISTSSPTNKLHIKDSISAIIRPD